MKKVKIQICNRHTGSVLFEYESEGNTIAKTLEKAIESSADLRFADLSFADLSSANLRSANLRSANLRFADLRSAKNSDYAVAITRILPEGDIIGYKKCRDGEIAKLLIPSDAKRSHAYDRKCRAEWATVLDITKGARHYKKGISHYDSKVVYTVGQAVKPTKPFDDDWTNDCGSGIHFYITKLEAENHEF